MKHLAFLVAAVVPLLLASPARAAEPAPAVATVAALREPLHDIELHSRALLAEGRQPQGFLPFLRAYADLRDHLDTLVSKGDYGGAVVTARADLQGVERLAQAAGLHDFDPELARCEAILSAPRAPNSPRP